MRELLLKNRFASPENGFVYNLFYPAAILSSLGEYLAGGCDGESCQRSAETRVATENHAGSSAETRKERIARNSGKSILRKSLQTVASYRLTEC
jgi:hypothetical protein